MKKNENITHLEIKSKSTLPLNIKIPNGKWSYFLILTKNIQNSLIRKPYQK